MATTFVNDTFTDTDATTLSSHTGETGATWVRNGSYGAFNCQIISNRLRNSSANETAFYASGAPATADYSVTADVKSVTTTDGQVGPAGRMDSTVRTFYFVEAVQNASDIELQKVVASTYTQLATVAHTFVLSEVNTLKLGMVGTSISMTINGGTPTTVTDSDISAAGRAGVFFSTGVAPTDTNQLHLDNFLASGDALIFGDVGVITGPIPILSAPWTPDAPLYFDYGDTTLPSALTAFQDVQLRFRLSARSFKDVALRFGLAVRGYKDVGFRASLTARSFKDVALRFRLSANAVKDVGLRFFLAVRGYKDVALRFALRAQTWKDVGLRFRLSALAYKDIALRFRLSARAFQDVALRFRLSAAAFKDVQLRFRLSARSFKDLALRFALTARSFKDIAIRFRLSVLAYKDVGLRFSLVIAGATTAYKDIALRFGLSIRAFQDVGLRFGLSVRAFKDVSLRASFAARSYKDVGLRFRLSSGAASQWIYLLQSGRFALRVTNGVYIEV